LYSIWKEEQRGFVARRAIQNFRQGRKKVTMTTKQRNRVLTFAEAITQNQKTARIWVELRYNIPICAYFLVRIDKTCRVIPYNLGIGSFVVGEEDYGTKWRCWEKEPTREETKREPWSAP
jgi:hypothetical protein